MVHLYICIIYTYYIYLTTENVKRFVVRFRKSEKKMYVFLVVEPLRSVFHPRAL